ncbi:MAG: hypothetical protein WD448_07105 [Woeseia sp.]
MNNLVLTEYQSACRAAHEQVQLLRDLYEHLSSSHSAVASDPGVQQRLGELQGFLDVLARELERQDLLPSQPDPEKEEALEFLTGLKGRFTTDDNSAVRQRLAAEEKELLRLIGTLRRENSAVAPDDCLAATREAIHRLSPPDNEQE